MDEDLVPAHLLRALRYLDMVERGHGTCDVVHLDQYVSSTPPKAGWSYISGMRSWHEMLSAGSTGVSDYLARVGWIEEDSAFARLTDTGRAIVRASTMRPDPDGSEVVTVLSPDDPLNLLTLTGAISAARGDTLVDPYFRDENLSWLISQTAISRLLLCRGSNHLGMLGMAAPAASRAGRPLEIRYLPKGQLHDRYIIAKDGSVSMIGASINGLHRNFTAIVTVPEPGARAVREFVDERWGNAEGVRPWNGLEPPSESESDTVE